ncbi:MAG: hypothetical protein HFE92_01255 [Acutalibacter muris]|nr:hypothetical protein [Acutalibacter muris]
MCPMKDNLEIMDDPMNGISQTKVWAKIQLTDPKIKEAQEAFEICLNKLKGTEQESLMEELYDAVLNLNCAFEYPTILYGIRVAYALQTVSADSAALSQHIMDRIIKCREGRT